MSPETLKIIDFPLFFNVFLIFEVSNISMDFGWILVRLGGLLGTSWGVLGRLGGVLGASWRVLGASWAHLGASWERLGTSWPPSSLQDRKKLEKPTKNHHFINLI